MDKLDCALVEVEPGYRVRICIILEAKIAIIPVPINSVQFIYYLLIAISLTQ